MPSETKSFIQLRGLTKEYVMGENTVHALRGVNMDIVKGEFVAVMGASGSGKSTLMNILGCLDTPSGGEYLFETEQIQKFTANNLAALRNRKMGFVFQSFNLLPRTTALENVELPLLYNKAVSPKQARKKAMEALSWVGLDSRAFHYSNQLSGGQQQRVAIARAIVNDPLILLADEPTGNLDSAMSVEIMALFEKLNRDQKTVIMVTHEPDIAQYAHRKVTFRDGHILSDEQVSAPRSAIEELTQRVSVKA